MTDADARTEDDGVDEDDLERQGDAERFTPFPEPATPEPHIDADAVEDAIVAALAGLVQEVLEAEGEADVAAVFGNIDYAPLVDAGELAVQNWLDRALAHLQGDAEIEYVGTDGVYRPLEGDDHDRDGRDGDEADDLWTVATKGLDEAETFRRAGDQANRAERAMADVDLNAVAAISDKDARQFLHAKKTVREIALRARENQRGAERGRSSDGVGETVSNPGGDPQ